MTFIFDDVVYDVYPEDSRINAVPLTGAVFKRDNAGVHKFLSSLTQGIKSWNWIEKSRGWRDAMKTLR